MQRKHLLSNWIWLLAVILGCIGISAVSRAVSPYDDARFNSRAWKSRSRERKQPQGATRTSMVSSLEGELRPGMSRTTAVDLLGKPDTTFEINDESMLGNVPPTGKLDVYYLEDPSFAFTVSYDAAGSLYSTQLRGGSD